jgi:predicted kinase
MGKLIILCGLSASNKSSYAKTLEDTVIVSSDDIREELSYRADQSQNGKVFRIFHSRIDSLLKEGKTVVADATNITMKSRRPLIDIGKRNKARIECHLLLKQIGRCVADDEKRNYSVGYKVIVKQVRRFEVPFYEEGFDDIKLIGERKDDDNFFFYEWLNNADIYNQHNPHHNLTLGEHCRKVSKFFWYYAEHDIIEKYGDGAMYHDLGKPYSRTFDDNKVAHYYSHANVGAYLYILNMLGCANERYIIDNAFVINYHMRPFTWTEDKTREKYRKVFGDEKYNVLMLLNDCDKKGSTDEH